MHRLRVVSVCRLLPTPESPSSGTFVLNRLAAMASHADLEVIQPVPYLPVVRSLPAWAATEQHATASLAIRHAPMLYVPGVLKGLDGLWLARSIRGHLRRLQKSGRIDALDAHFGHPEGTGCARLAAELGLPFFVTIRGTEADMLQRPALREQLLAALNAAAGCISVSHSLRDLVVANGVDQQRVTVIPNGVNRRLFQPGDQAAARAALGIDPRTRLLVSVGHLLSVKRHATLIEAMRRLRQDMDVKLAIIGGPSYEPDEPAALRKQVDAAGLGDGVSFKGALPPNEVARWLQAADAFALASAREGCCNALLEALAAGLPAVVTRVGDNAHFVQPGSNGALVDVDDPAGMHMALAEVLSRSWTREAISRWLDVGDWDSVGSRVMEFFDAQLRTSRAA
jgi:glycosyltransferase involved in cell wall biosynthesis